MEYYNMNIKIHLIKLNDYECDIQDLILSTFYKTIEGQKKCSR